MAWEERKNILVGMVGLLVMVILGGSISSGKVRTRMQKSVKRLLRFSCNVCDEFVVNLRSF